MIDHKYIHLTKNRRKTNAIPEYKLKVFASPICSTKDRNVRLTMKLKSQFVVVARLFPTPLIGVG